MANEDDDIPQYIVSALEQLPCDLLELNDGAISAFIDALGAANSTRRHLLRSLYALKPAEFSTGERVPAWTPDYFRSWFERTQQEPFPANLRKDALKRLSELVVAFRPIGGRRQPGAVWREAATKNHNYHLTMSRAGRARYRLWINVNEECRAQFRNIVGTLYHPKHGAPLCGTTIQRIEAVRRGSTPHDAEDPLIPPVAFVRSSESRLAELEEQLCQPRHEASASRLLLGRPAFLRLSASEDRHSGKPAGKGIYLAEALPQMSSIGQYEPDPTSSFSFIVDELVSQSVVEVVVPDSAALSPYIEALPPHLRQYIRIVDTEEPWRLARTICQPIAEHFRVGLFTPVEAAPTSDLVDLSKTVEHEIGLTLASFYRNLARFLTAQRHGLQVALDRERFLREADTLRDSLLEVELRSRVSVVRGVVAAYAPFHVGRVEAVRDDTGRRTIGFHELALDDDYQLLSKMMGLLGCGGAPGNLRTAADTFMVASRLAARHDQLSTAENTVLGSTVVSRSKSVGSYLPPIVNLERCLSDAHRAWSRWLQEQGKAEVGEVLPWDVERRIDEGIGVRLGLNRND